MPYLWAEAIYAVRYEMARTVSDVLVRRIPIRYLDSSRAGRAAPAVAHLLQRELGAPPAELERQVAELIDDIERERMVLSAL